MAIRIRDATPADAGAIARVHVDSWRTTYAGIVPAAHLAGLSYERRGSMWLETISRPQPGAFTLAAEADGAVIAGFAAGGPERSGDPAYRGEVYAVYLLEAWQRQGAGRALLLECAARLQAEKFTTMLIWVLERNPACGFYARLGGTPVRRQEIVIGGAPLVEVAYGSQALPGSTPAPARAA